MTHYYHLDSDGENTNLQLYSLKQAMRYWDELVLPFAESGNAVVNNLKGNFNGKSALC